tara:strand:+ start:7127 stop:7831 length:705 start_codon:yes stop_codon:yes gene_type:complete
MTLPEFTYFTFTNSGYTHYTHNLLESIKQNKLNLNLKIITLDEVSYKFFSDKHKNLTLFSKENFSEELLQQTDEGFGNLMIVKFELIYRELLENENVVYLDGDITLKKNITEYLYNFSKQSEIIFQNDLRPSKPNLINVCAGFMYIKSSKKTINFFKPEEKLVKKFNKYKTHDQTYINKNKNKFKYTMLPLSDFPNGAHYYKNHNDLDPYLIHFNYVIGEKKQELMKSYGEWYI